MPKIKRDSGGDHTSKAKRRKESSGQGKDGILHNSSVFGKLINKAGFVLKTGNKPDELCTDHAVFQRDLASLLKKHSDYPQVIEEFAEELGKHIDNQARFRWSLMSTITPVDCEASAHGGTQDSLMKLLLGIDMLQPSVMNLLLEKLAEFTGDEEPIFDQTEKVNMPRLIMNQFKWLDHIVDSKEVTSKMLEILTIMPVEIQREVITCLPEVVDDQEHVDVANALRDLLTQNNDLAGPILDAMSNLTLKPDLLIEVRASVVQTLPSVELQDLPVVVKFLLQTVSNDDALEVITELRSHLDFHSSFPPTNSSTPQSDRRSSGNSDKNAARGSEALTVDAIRSAIRFQKSIAEAWIKAVEAEKSAADHKAIDLIVLFILHVTNWKKSIQSLFRNKIRSGCFTEVLLQLTFSSHSQVLRELFPGILSLAESLLRSPEPAVCYFACAMYKHAFSAFDTYCQQEIVGNLVTHIGSGFIGEIDSSLDILADLVDTNLSKMAPFAVFVKGVLDYLENLSMAQIRKLYSMLSMLAFRNPQEGALMQDEMNIIIRKQLSNNSSRYKQMGVIGAIMIIKSLAISGAYGDESQTFDGTTSSTDLSISEEAFKQVTNLLQLVRTSSRRSPEAGALFMDEMASVLQKDQIDSRVEAWITDNIINDFQEDFVIDADPNLEEESQILPTDQLFGLDEDSEGAIAISILPLVAKVYEQKPLVTGKKNVEVHQVSPVNLCSHFRLLQTCEKQQHDGDLEGIDALLGCCLCVPKLEVIDKMESLSQKEKEVLCDCLFYTANWFREIVNAFAGEKDPEMKAKVISRLQSITDIQGLLEKCLAVTPKYIPPKANFDQENVVSPQSAAGGAGAGAGKKGPSAGKKGKKKKKNKNEKENTQQDNDESRIETQAEKDTETDDENEPEAAKPTVDLNRYRAFFRELDLGVFEVLRVGLIKKAALDTEMNTKQTTVLEIKPPQLQFLLDDLSRKLEHALIAYASKRRTFLKVRADKNAGFSHLDLLGAHTVATRIIKLLPCLCDHLEGTSAFFQDIIAANDGMIDGPGHKTEEAQHMGTCLHLLLQALLALFSWNGFLIAENRDMLKGALTVLASRMNAQTTSQLTLQDALRHAFHYLENFSATVPNLAAAVTLSKLLVALVERSDSQELSKKVADLTQGFLKREWLGPDGERGKGAKHNEHLQGLLKIYFSYTEDGLAAVENISSVGIVELAEGGKDSASDTYQTLTRHSFPVFYRVMLAELVEHVKTLSAGKQGDAVEVKKDKLITWKIAVLNFQRMVSMIKAFDARPNLGAVLKYGRQFVDHFVRQGMPLLDHMFRGHKDDVQGLLKTLQLATRSLHHMCGHSKINKDVALTNQVPQLKKCLEAFVYRVKAMLAMNKCAEAFWIGNLKNRDLQGEEIVTQSSNTHDDSSDSDDVPEDDDSDETDAQSAAAEGSKDSDESTSDVEGSYSECY